MSAISPVNPGAGGIGAHLIESAADRRFDLVVVGGGITGAWATAMAAAAGLKVGLVESGDFGGATSRVSHRILHGGFRYLQSGDIARLRESVRERREWFRCFPDLVRPLPCLMPLYGRGLKRPMPFRAATLAYGVLAADRNRGVPAELRLGAGGVVPLERTKSLFPRVRTEGLRGAGEWHDGVALSHPRLILSLLRFAASSGAVCLNHTPAVGIDWRCDEDIGVRVRTAEGIETTIDTVSVLNTASVWASAWDERMRQGDRPIVPKALAFNLFLDLPPVSGHGVAVEPPETDENGERRVYFLVPRAGRIAAGTTHLPTSDNATEPKVSWPMIDRMLAGLNAAVRGLGATREHVLRVDAGLLPAAAPGSAEPSDRPTIVDHRASVGIGVLSAVAVKYTTARHTAAVALRQLLDGHGFNIGDEPSMKAIRKGLAEHRPELDTVLLLDPEPDPAAILARADDLLAFCRAEGVWSISDLILGRTEWGTVPAHGLRVAEALWDTLADGLGWGGVERSQELERLAHALPGSLPKIGEELTTSGDDSAP